MLLHPRIVVAAAARNTWYFLPFVAERLSTSKDRIVKRYSGQLLEESLFLTNARGRNSFAAEAFLIINAAGNSGLPASFSIIHAAGFTGLPPQDTLPPRLRCIIKNGFS